MADLSKVKIEGTSYNIKDASARTGLASKQDTLVSGTNIKTIEGQSLLGSGNIDLTKADVGLGNVDNTSDANKPISTATQTALNKKLGRLLVDGTLPDSSTPVTISLTDDQINTIRSGQVDQILIYNDDSSVTYAFDKMFVNDGEGDYYFYCHLHFGSSSDNRYYAMLEGNSFTIKKVDPAHDSTKQDTLINQTNIKSVDGQSLLGSGNLNSVKMTSITWAALKALRDGGNLVPGQQYRITDYQCTTSTKFTTSAGHQFDIIVTADSASKLNEKARAAIHADDAYFANSKLDAWELWYSLDNDTTRFAWADSTNGKGVIYRMIDEFGNDLPYDFKNMLFTDSSETPKYTNAYTFSYTQSSVIKDASLLANKKCYHNVMKEYIISNKQQLNFNVFYSASVNSNCYSNTFGTACYSNTFCFNCYNCIFGNDCNSNIFGNSCSSNTFGNFCHSNTFGISCNSNTFGNNCQSNTFGNGCSFNAFSSGCTFNSFGTNCNLNVFDNDCGSNTFGNHCVYNTLGNSCSYITFGDSSSAIYYCRNIIVDNGCNYLYINCVDTSASSSNYLQNVHVHSGVQGSSSTNRKTISVPDRALAYSIDYYANNSQTIILD